MKLSWKGNGADLLLSAAETLGSEGKARRAYSMALNDVGKSAKAATVKALAKQVGLGKQALMSHGAIKEYKAKKSDLIWTLQSTGKHLPLKLFGARQFSYGVRAKPWGRAQRFPGSFINAGTYRSGQPVLGGHVLHRAGPKIILDDFRMKASWHGRKFQPFKVMYGPAVPVEMVKDESERAFTRAAGKLPDRLAHIVARMTEGVVT